MKLRSGQKPNLNKTTEIDDMKNLTKTALLLAVTWSALLVAGCDAPLHTVISSKSMVVYHAEKLEIEDVGAYEY